MRLLGVLLIASCSSSATTPVTPGESRAEPKVARPGDALAKPLAGPFADLEAYCATQVKGDDRECRVLESDQATAAKALTAAPLTELAILFVSSQPPTSGCAIALRTAGGWYVTPPSTDVCREPSYIEVRDVRVDVDGRVVAVHVDVNWHTKGPSRGQGDETADYTITTFCGALDKPVCVPPFTTKCDKGAPAADCMSRGFEASWKLDGETLTIDSKPRSVDPNVPHGTHRLF